MSNAVALANDSPARRAKHSSSSVELYTPADIVECSRSVLGGEIHLDPASCEFANRVVRAERIFDEARDGLNQPWWGSVFLNPPGGALRLADRGTKSRQVRWWLKLCDEYEQNRVESAIFICFSLEMFQACQEVRAPHPLHFPVCIPKKRLRFDSRAREVDARLRAQLDGLPLLGEESIRIRCRLEDIAGAVERDERLSGDQPTHANAIVYLPTRPRRFDDAEAFASAFSRIGFVRT